MFLLADPVLSQRHWCIDRDYGWQERSLYSHGVRPASTCAPCCVLYQRHTAVLCRLTSSQRVLHCSSGRSALPCSRLPHPSHGVQAHDWVTPRGESVRSGLTTGIHEPYLAHLFLLCNLLVFRHRRRSRRAPHQRLTLSSSSAKTSRTCGQPPCQVIKRAREPVVKSELWGRLILNNRLRRGEQDKAGRAAVLDARALNSEVYTRVDCPLAIGTTSPPTTMHSSSRTDSSVGGLQKGTGCGVRTHSMESLLPLHIPQRCPFACPSALIVALPLLIPTSRRAYKCTAVLSNLSARPRQLELLTQARWCGGKCGFVTRGQCGRTALAASSSLRLFSFPPPFFLTLSRCPPRAQIPQGAVPCAGAFYTKVHRVSLAPLQTNAVTFSFYWPGPCTRARVYPCVAAAGGVVVGRARPGCGDTVDVAKPAASDAVCGVCMRSP